MTDAKKRLVREVQLVAPIERESIIPRNPYSKYEAPLVDFGPSLTKQSFTDECDINHIMSRYEKTGTIEHLNTRLAQFADVDNIDFQQAQNTVIQANELFAQLPAKIREQFDQNPGAFLEFALNPASAPELVAMGLLDPTDLHVFSQGQDAPTAHISVPDASSPPSTTLSDSS